MFLARWRTFIRPLFIPPVVVMGTAAMLSLAAAQLAVAAPRLATSVATDCTTAGAALRAMSRQTAPAPSVTQRVDATGTYVGRQIVIATRPTAVSLPAESFVGTPDGDALVYTTSAAGKSEVHLIDLASGCDALIARPAGTARSAILGPDGTAIFAHSVTYPNRADAGVARYALDGSDTHEVVPPLPDDPRFGPTFGTQLGWSSDKASLTVQSCGIDACRTRVLEATSGMISTYDADGQGPIIGLTPTHLVTFSACDGVPCPVISIDRLSGVTSTLSNEAWSATVNGNVVEIVTASSTLEVAQ